MTDIEKLRADLKTAMLSSGYAQASNFATMHGKELIDTITTLRAENAALREGLVAINSLGGNVDHDKPGGSNDAAMRGGLLMTAKQIARALLEKNYDTCQ